MDQALTQYNLARAYFFDLEAQVILARDKYEDARKKWEKLKAQFDATASASGYTGGGKEAAAAEERVDQALTQYNLAAAYFWDLEAQVILARKKWEKLKAQFDATAQEEAARKAARKAAPKAPAAAEGSAG